MKVRNVIAVAALTACAATGVAAVGVSGASASASSATHVSHQLPAWFHWAWASRAARADCHGGPAIIVWVGNSDQSALVCKRNAAIWPS